MKKRHLAIAMIVLIALVTPLGRYAIGAFRPVDVVSVHDAAASVRTPGKPALIVLYGPRCPLSEAAFPGIVALAREAAAGGAEVLAYSTDDGIDRYLVGGFLSGHRAPFAARRILRWEPGQLSSEFSALGIPIGDTWMRPLIAVRSSTGRIIYQAQAPKNLDGAKAALDRVLVN